MFSHFFFSSRRRHTRLTCDWSSDVCSSDLEPRVTAYAQDLAPRAILVNIPSLQLETVEDGKVFSRHNIVAGKLDRPSPTLVRSEERRVGKEWRYGWEWVLWY